MLSALGVRVSPAHCSAPTHRRMRRAAGMASEKMRKYLAASEATSGSPPSQ